MNNFIGYEGLTNEQIKTKVLTEFYLTGKVNGYYMTKIPKGKVNPLKYYILRWLKYNDTMCLTTTAQDYVDDFYHMLFADLFSLSGDRFCIGAFGKKGKWLTPFFNKKGELNHQKLCAFACLMIQRQGFYSGKNGYTGKVLLPLLMFASTLNDKNDSVEPHQNDDSFEDEPSVDDFLSDYRFIPDKITNQLTDDELTLFSNSLGKRYIPKSEKYLAFKEKIRRLKDEL